MRFEGEPHYLTRNSLSHNNNSKEKNQYSSASGKLRNRRMEKRAKGRVWLRRGATAASLPPGSCPPPGAQTQQAPGSVEGGNPWIWKILHHARRLRNVKNPKCPKYCYNPTRGWSGWKNINQRAEDVEFLSSYFSNLILFIFTNITKNYCKRLLMCLSMRCVIIP